MNRIYALVAFCITINFSFAQVTTTPASGNGNCDGTAELTDPWMYTSITWFDLNQQVIGTDTNVVSGLCPGTYTVEVADSSQSTTPITYVIEEDSLGCSSLVATISSQNATAGACDGYAQVSATGGTSPYAYLWSNNETSTGIQGLCAGAYTVTVTDVNGCSYTQSINVNEDSSSVDCSTLNAATSVTNTSEAGLCDGEVVATASGGVAPYAFNWDNGDSSSMVMNACEGVYVVTVTDANGCTYSHTSVVEADSANNANCNGFAGTLTITNASGDSICDGMVQTTLNDGVGPFMYTWNNGQSTSSILQGVCGGTNVVVEIVDANGCTISLTGYVEADSSNVPGNGNTPDCSTLDLQVTQVNPTVSGACDGGIEVQGVGGVAPYMIEENNNISLPNTALCEGDYIITVADSNGCTVTRIVSLVADSSSNVVDCSLMTISSSVIPTSGANVCDGIIDISVNGAQAPLNITWDNGANGLRQDSVCAGTYVIDVTDANGCVQVHTVVVDADSVNFNACSGFGLSATAINVSVSGTCDGMAEANAWGATGNVQYTWSNGDVGSIVNNLCEGTYYVEAIDDASCTSVYTIVVGVDATSNPIIVDLNITDETDVAMCDGAVEVLVSGGTAPYEIMHSDSTFGAVKTGLCQGYYTATVTDANGVVETVSYLIVGQDNVHTTTTFTDSTIVDTINVDPIENCGIDYTNVYEVYILESNMISNTELEVVWAVVYIDQTVDQITQIYVIDPNTAGTVSLALTMICPSKALPQFIKALDNVYLEGTPLSAIETRFDYSIYPNPTAGEVMVAVEGETNYAVYSLSGSIVRTGVFVNSVTIDLSLEESGVYFVVLQKDDQVINTRVVKK